MLSKAKGDGYSIWLVPTKSVYAPLERIMNRLSHEHSDHTLGYQAPRFGPHITLISGVSSRGEAIAKTLKLASLIKQFDVRFSGFGQLDDEYFRCVFIKVAETKGLMDANKAARQVFNKAKAPKYMPHLSLIYGLFPSATRKEIIYKVKRINPGAAAYKFHVGKISLYRTKDTVDKWYKVRDFKVEA